MILIKKSRLWLIYELELLVETYLSIKRINLIIKEVTTLIIIEMLVKMI